MKQDERRRYLIEYLMKEDKRFMRQKMPADTRSGREDLWRHVFPRGAAAASSGAADPQGCANDEKARDKAGGFFAGSG